MALEKLTIRPRPPSRLAEVQALFNPAEYRITKSVTWSDEGTNRGLNAPLLTFGGGGARTLTLELFFDVTEPVRVQGRVAALADVRRLTDRVVALTRIERDLGEPPVCTVMWGRAATRDFPFVGVITSLGQHFTLFRENGTPVRATLDLTFTEYLDPEADQRQTDPELTTHVVQRGDSLPSIAARLYGDPKRWRVIADANHVDDPRRLDVLIGRRLTIPKVD